MKLELDFDDLERQWKVRQLDLFPWLDGLFALLRSRDSLVKETKKRLSSSSQATMVQFLSSDDHDNALVAKETIKEQSAGSILPILLYSLEKVEKVHYSRRVMESLLDFDPIVSIGHLLGYLNLRPDLKDKIFLVLSEIFPLKDLFPNPKDALQFLVQFFQALSYDLKERIPLPGKLDTMEAFNSIKLNLKVMLLIFDKTWQGENARVVEKEMQGIGQRVIVSLHKLPFEFENGPVLLGQLSEIIPFMALMRLESDKSFLNHLPTKMKSTDLSQEEIGEIVQKSEAALKIIEQPEKTIQEILEQFEGPLFL